MARWAAGSGPACHYMLVEYARTAALTEAGRGTAAPSSLAAAPRVKRLCSCESDTDILSLLESAIYS
eukprot:6197678-Pleurochrysis_carterae.AAC.1